MKDPNYQPKYIFEPISIDIKIQLTEEWAAFKDQKRKLEKMYSEFVSAGTDPWKNEDFNANVNNFFRFTVYSLEAKWREIQNEQNRT